MTSTLIYGPTEGIVVDMQNRKIDAARFADRIVSHHIRLKAIILTHPHDDHWGAIGILRQWFPDVPVFVSADGLALYRKDTAQAHPQLPDILALPSSDFLIDGQRVEVFQAQGDEATSSNSCVWIPGLRTLVAGDVVFNNVHVWLATSTAESRSAWLRSLEKLSSLKPLVVVPGHKLDPSGSNDPNAIAFTAQYIRDFEAAASASPNPDELAAKMKSKYPQLGLAEKVLTRSVKRPFEN